MASIIKTIFQFRRATAAEWEANKTVIPACGEPCFVTDKNMLKIGDGETTFENLEPINGVNVEVAADGKSVVVEDGIFQLMGFEAAEIGAQPRKAADGTIEWIVPSTDTLEGLQSTIAGLKSDVEALQEIIGTPEGENPLTVRVKSVEDAIGILNGDATVEGSVQKAVTDGINTFATQISDDGVVNSYKELIDYVANHGGDAATMAADISVLQALVGEDSVKDQISNALAESSFMTKDQSMAMFEQVKYEISHKPVDTLVDRRDKEIRIMCPASTVWALQQSGEGADASKYYIGLKAYAPEGAVSFKEDLAEIISDDTMYYFEGNNFAGIDANGRKYSIVWLPVAEYDENTQTWNYYGAKSTTKKYIGWYYSVEWYDVSGIKIASDCIKINLSNEDCHAEIKPFYMTNVIDNIVLNGTVLDAVDGQVNIPLGAGLKGSDEIKIEEDGTLRIKGMSWDKLLDGESELVMDGGGAI